MKWINCRCDASCLTVVLAGGVDECPVVQREQLEESEDRTEHCTESPGVRLVEHLTENDGKNEKEGEHEEDDGTHGLEGLQASVHDGLEVVEEAGPGDEGRGRETDQYYRLVFKHTKESLSTVTSVTSKSPESRNVTLYGTFVFIHQTLLTKTT